MTDKLVSIGSEWQDGDSNRIVIVREIISEDGDLWIKYSAHAQDTLYSSTYDKFFTRFTRIEK